MWLNYGDDPHRHHSPISPPHIEDATISDCTLTTNELVHKGSFCAISPKQAKYPVFACRCASRCIPLVPGKISRDPVLAFHVPLFLIFTGFPVVPLSFSALFLLIEVGTRFRQFYWSRLKSPHSLVPVSAFVRLFAPRFPFVPSFVPDRLGKFLFRFLTEVYSAPCVITPVSVTVLE